MVRLYKSMGKRNENDENEEKERGKNEIIRRKGYSLILIEGNEYAKLLFVLWKYKEGRIE